METENTLIEIFLYKNFLSKNIDIIQSSIDSKTNLNSYNFSFRLNLFDESSFSERMLCSKTDSYPWRWESTIKIVFSPDSDFNKDNTIEKLAKDYPHFTGIVKTFSGSYWLINNLQLSDSSMKNETYSIVMKGNNESPMKKLDNEIAKKMIYD